MTEHIDPAIVEQVAAAIRATVAEDWVDQYTIDVDTRLSQDLELESIEVVKIITSLQEHFGSQADLAGWLAGRSFDELIELRIGDIAAYLTSCAAARTSHG